MNRSLSLAQHTLYADLLDQGSDDLFDPDLPENGSLLMRGNRAGTPAEHVYYQGYRCAAGDDGRGQRYARYLGRSDDPEVSERIARFERVKAVRAERTTTVRALIGAGMPRPDRMAGRVIEALARAGLFTDDAVLIGEAASQTYASVIGVRLAKSRNAVGRDRSAVEIVVRNSRRSADILTALRTIDPSFAAEPATTGTYTASTGVRVGSTSLDRVNEETANLIGFLIADPVHAVVLHGPGLPVIVPAPERFAIHALIERNACAAALLDGIASADRQHAFARGLATAVGSGLLSDARLAESMSQLPSNLVAMIDAPI